MRRLVPALLAIAILATPAVAIVVRHDRPDYEFRCFPRDYPAVCRVGAGLGTLVAPRWVLTAAHVADGLMALHGTVRFGPREIGIARVVFHPDYAKPGSHRDLALVELAEPVTDVAPVALYAGASEAGRPATLVGDGESGNGRTGPASRTRDWRSARNVVETAADGWLTFRFDAPPAGEDLEGIGGPGDDGGPAFVLVDTTLTLIGVNAFNDGGVSFTYGTLDHYARVADARAWIDAVLRGEDDDDAGTVKP